MGKHISDRLHACRHIMSSDEDQPIVMDIYAGFTPRGELAIAVDRHDYDEPEYNCSTAAIVCIDDAKVMARRNKVEYHHLPHFIAGCMEDWREIVNADLRQVTRCFKEITECLIDEGCRFRIERTYGRRDTMCC